MATKLILLIIALRTKSVEARTSPEKDKLGQLGVFTWVTNQNVRDLKETVNKYIQDAPDADDSLIKRLVVIRNQLHEIWKSLNPS